MILGKGSGYWAIDVDDMAQWEVFKAELGADLNQTATEQTGSGKFHLVYQRPDEEDVPAQALRRGEWSAAYPKIEVLTKNILAVAPSPHHKTGQPGQWLEAYPQQPQEPARALLARRAVTRLDEMITERQLQVHIDREARRREASRGWQPPSGTAPLSAELAVPRATYAHRIEGLAGWNHNVLIAGERKVGKSTLLFNLTAGLSVAGCAPDGAGGWLWTPGTFLGPWTKCWASGTVAYWNAEMDADDFRDEFRKLPAGTFDASRIYPLHLRGAAVPVITSPAAREWFCGWLKEKAAETLILDTWGAFCAANGVRNLSDDAEVRVVTSGLDEIKAATGVRSVFIPIHTPHQTGERHLERFKGAGAVGDWADTLWTYVKDSAGVRYLWAEGRAGIGRDETSVSWSTDTGLLSWSYEGNRAQTARDRQREKITEALRRAGDEGLATEALKDAAGGHRNEATGVIAELERAGVIEIETLKRSKIHRLKSQDSSG